MSNKNKNKLNLVKEDENDDYKYLDEFELREDLIYRYKGALYETTPILDYLIIRKERYKDKSIAEIISDRHIHVPTVISFFVLLISILILIISEVKQNSENSVESFTNSIVSIPTEMYFNNEISILDIDIPNYIDNNVYLSLKLYAIETKEVILDLEGIMPGETIGAIPISLLREYTYPLRCILYYTQITTEAPNKNRTLEVNVTIIDNNIANKEINSKF